MKAIGIGLAAIAGLLALPWVLGTNDILMTRILGPKAEAARRATFEQTKSFQDGTVQELERLQVEFLRADTGARSALTPIILHRATAIDRAVLPPTLRTFIDSLDASKAF